LTKLYNVTKVCTGCIFLFIDRTQKAYPKQVKPMQNTVKNEGKISSEFNFMQTHKRLLPLKATGPVQGIENAWINHHLFSTFLPF